MLESDSGGIGGTQAENEQSLRHSSRASSDCMENRAGQSSSSIMPGNRGIMRTSCFESHGGEAIWR